MLQVHALPVLAPQQLLRTIKTYLVRLVWLDNAGQVQRACLALLGHISLPPRIYLIPAYRVQLAPLPRQRVSLLAQEPTRAALAGKQ